MSKQRHSHAIRNIDLYQDLLKVVFLLLNLSGANIETLHIIQCCQSEIYNQNISDRCVKSAAFARHELTLKDVDQLWEKNDRRNSGGKLRQKFNHIDCRHLTFNQWTNGPMDQGTN